MAAQSSSRKTEPRIWRQKLGYLCCISPRDPEPEDPNIYYTSPTQNQTPTTAPLTVPSKDAGIPHVPPDQPPSSPPGNQNMPSSSRSTVPLPEDRFGMFSFQPESANSSIDIVAVHGLGGHYEDTWTWNPPKPDSGSPCNWLKDLLPSKFPDARIMSFGYNSAVALSKSISDISTFGEQLLQRVLFERRSEQQRHRPIVFVCHSLGGIIAKKALMYANERRNQRTSCSELLENVKGIIFMGTPHRGSDAADLGSMAAEMLKAASLGRNTNTTLINQLRRGSEMLREISNAFVFLGANVRIYTFYETDRMDWLSDVIVTQDSAKLNVPNEDVFPINGNHSTLCKFPVKSQDYKFIEGIIEDLAGAPRIDTSKYLAGLDLLATYFPQYPYHQAEEADRVHSQQAQDLAWFFESPEFTSWDRHESEFLWLSGIPRSGKTVLSFCLWDHLRRNRTYNRCEDIAIYFCSSAVNLDPTPEGPTAQILSTLIIQLLRSDKKRLELVAREYPLPDLSIGSSLPQSLLHDLWKILYASVIALPTHQVIIIIDAIDEVRTERARQNFLRNLLQLQKEVLSKGVTGFKIFITSKPFDDIKKELRAVPNIEKDKERQECLRTLKFDEFSARRDRVEGAHTGTGEWLASDVGYTSWDSSNCSSLLLIRGKPGSGKSTLAKHLLDSKKSNYAPTQSPDDEEARATPDVLIADFFYSFRGGKRETSHILMLQSLLFQLLSQDERLFPLFRDIYRARRNVPDFKWQYEDLKRLFAALPSLKTQQKIYIFLDAMDESTEQGRPEILVLLRELCSSKSNCIFKCLIASRPLPAGEIDDDGYYRIILEEKNRGDIEKLITSGLRDIQKRPGGSAVDFQFAHNYMVKHAEGVFLWVALVLKELEKLTSAGASQEELEYQLRKLPRDLEDMYELIIQRLVGRPDPAFPDVIEKGARMLTWVTFAERPLRMEEFHDAVVMPPISKPFNPGPEFLKRTKVHGFDHRIRACCGPLLEIRQSVVQLLHLTVREYLLRKDKRAKPFDTDEERGDTAIASGCIRYLRLLSSRPSTRDVGSWGLSDYDEFVNWLAGYPLLEYVVSFLPKHSERLVNDSPVLSELSLFLQALRKEPTIFYLFESWAEQLDRPGTTDLQPGVESGQFRIKCLIAAARNGYTPVVESVIKLHTDINGTDKGRGTFALQEAAEGGHLEVIEKLLAAGANVDAPAGSGGKTALQAAAEGGHLEVVQRLLDMGANVNAPAGSGGKTALQAAAEGGHLEVIEKLLAAGANVDAPTGSGGKTALQAATEGGHLEVIQRLLEVGATL